MAWVIAKHKRLRPLPTAITGPQRVKVGFPASAASGVNIDKAFYNEFGTRGGASGGGWGGPIPERPFMRNSVRDNGTNYRNMLKKMAKAILNGSLTLRQAMAQLGLQGVRDIQQEIGSLRSPPNSPVTVRLKGSSKPLIDSGEMRQAVTYKVEE